LHHLSTLNRRRLAARELLRITKPGGRILISAWALEQDAQSRREFPAQDVLVAWNVPQRFVEEGPARQRATEVAMRTTQAAIEAAKAIQEANESGTDEERTVAAATATAIPSSSSSSSSAVASPSIQAPQQLTDPSGHPLLQFHRYCHVFIEGEIEKLFLGQFAEDELSIEDRYYDRGNWCVVVKKLK